jgi:cyclase
LLLLKNGRMVKGVRFGAYRDVGFPVTTAKIYDAQGADELIFLDITASQEGRRSLLDTIAKVADQCFMPLTVGGGVQTLDDIHDLLRAGADKVSINTAAVAQPDLIARGAERYGNQCMIVSIDAKRQADGRYEVMTHGGSRPSGLEPVAWAKTMARQGAGEIVITAIDREGTREGYDLELTRRVAEAVSIPVIASGGAGTLQHLVDGFTQGGASAVSAASIFHFTDQSVIKARSYMKTAGLDVRYP